MVGILVNPENQSWIAAVKHSIKWLGRTVCLSYHSHSQQSHVTSDTQITSLRILLKLLVSRDMLGIAAFGTSTLAYYAAFLSNSCPRGGNANSNANQ